jgi:hypothetical protein
MRRYREVNSDAEMRLILSGCECGGYDIIETCSTDRQQPAWQKYAACKCGSIRGRCRPSGGWSMVIDDGTHAPLSVTAMPDVG